MKLPAINIRFYIITYCLLRAVSSSAQDCDSNYFSFVYNASDFATYSKALPTPDNNVLCLQTNRLYFHGLTKFTPQGNTIFSYEYTAPYIANSYHSWTDLIFSDMAIASATAVYVTGSVTKHGLFFDNTESPQARTAAVISKLDKYGKVVWSRFFANATTDPLSFSNVVALTNGDVIVYLTTQVAYPFYGRVICLSAEGTTRWITTLNTGEFSSGNIFFPKRAIIQAKNGNIILADVVYKYDTNFNSGEYHFAALNSSDGSLVWETSYAYEDPLFVPNVISAAELPDGNLSFQTTTNILTAGDPVGLSKELNIITDSKGSIKNMIVTYPANDFINIIDAKTDENNGNQALLMQTSDGKPLLVQTDKNGIVNWSRKYGKSDENVPPSCFLKTDNGYDIFLSEFSKSFRMLRTDPIGRIDCDTTEIKIVQEALPLFNGNTNNIHTTNLPADNESPFTSGFFTVQNTVTTTIQKNTVCQKNIACCTDVVDTVNVHNISLCEGGAYQLPDKTVVKDSGTYYVSYKTIKGCDSVSFYRINIYKNPASLSLGLDTCLNNSDTLTLHATEGFDSYKWINTFQASPYYTIHQPGNYYVNVTNICGSKTDSVYIYKQCDFPIYMPNAFTPNGDYLNDVFKVPSLNANRLILLSIYNRWGKIIFQTNNINKGWDGNINGVPQQTGVYIYYLQMETILGKKINQKGTVVLIR